MSAVTSLYDAKRARTYHLDYPDGECETKHGCVVRGNRPDGTLVILIATGPSQAWQVNSRALIWDLAAEQLVYNPRHCLLEADQGLVEWIFANPTWGAGLESQTQRFRELGV